MYGRYGKPIRLLEAYISWRDERLELAEADSKADFPEFLYGPIRKSVYKGYSLVSPQWNRYASLENAQDFREHRIVGLNPVDGIGYVGDHGEYPGMRRSERPPASVIVDTYGGVYGITRQAIRNDDIGELLSRVPTDMGRSAGRFVAQTLIALIESNPTASDGNPFFDAATHGNNTTLALSEDSLADAVTAMENQVDDAGVPITVTPRYLIVKTARMELIARRIINSQLTGTDVQIAMAAGAGSNIFDKGNINPLAGIIPSDGVTREPFLTDLNNWLLMADPSDVPAFALAFLDGRSDPWVGLKNPVVRTALGPGEDPYEFDIDTLDYKVRMDFGVAPVDWRGAYRGNPA